MERFAKIAHGLSLTIIAKLYIKDICESPGYPSACNVNFPSAGSHLLKYLDYQGNYNEK